MIANVLKYSYGNDKELIMQLLVTFCYPHCDDMQLSLIECSSISLMFNPNQPGARIMIEANGQKYISIREFSRKEIHKPFEQWATKNAPVHDTREFGAFELYNEMLLWF